MRVLVVGSAHSMPDDVAAARELFSPDAVIAVNHAGRDWPRALDHWVTMHPELLPRWIKARQASARPDAGALWTAVRRAVPVGLAPRRVINWGGSSGLLAVAVAVLELKAARIVCAGIPLDKDQGHYDDPTPWRDAGNYRRAWLDHRDQMANVRSMGGWTAGLLGSPTKEWLDAK